VLSIDEEDVPAAVVRSRSRGIPAQPSQGTIIRGTGGCRAKLTATEPISRRAAGEGLPITIGALWSALQDRHRSGKACQVR
jgi:hypothetical protein